MATKRDPLADGIVAAAQAAARRDKQRQATAARRREKQTVRAVGYVRVSTDEQGDSGLGLEAQRHAITTMCAAREWELVEICEDVAGGSSLEQRPGLERAFSLISQGKVACFMVAKLDRLSRSVVDAASTIERARREGWNLVALDLGVDFSTAAGEAMANMTATFAQLERRLIGERTRAALAVRKAQGVKLGRPKVLTVAVRERILAERAAGGRWTDIATRLNDEAIPTAHGGQRWYPGTVRKVATGAEPGPRRTR